MTLSSESTFMAFWIATLLVRASGYPGMKVLTGVYAIRQYVMAHTITTMLTIVTKRLVFVSLVLQICLWLSFSVMVMR